MQRMHEAPHRTDVARAEGPVVSTWPVCADDERAAADRVLRCGKLNYWTGEEGRQFEREFAVSTETAYAVAVANGTVALELALWSLGVGPGDEVVVPSRTFVATASAVVRLGATPVFADVDREAQNITADSIADRLSSRTKAVIVVHLAGWPCDMDSIVAVARRHALYVIEDCAQATGARYHGRPVGSLGDVGAFSFCQDKIITTAGEGGMLVTNRLELWQRAWSLKDHGKSYEAVYHREHRPGFRWLHEHIGTNGRLTEVQSAIGRVALRKLASWLETRRRNAARLAHHFSTMTGLRTPLPPPHVEHSYYKFYTFVEPRALNQGWNRDRILAELNDQGIQCFTGSCSEVYLEKAFAPAIQPQERLPIARELGETSLVFPVDPTLGTSDMDRIAAAVRRVMARAQRNASSPRSLAA
jgi:dTDP-4-amino-4,6-dideoxygalactose transaminase